MHACFLRYYNIETIFLSITPMMLCKTVLSILLVALASISSLVDAFTITQRPSPRKGARPLHASSPSEDMMGNMAVVGFATGWILSTQLVGAAVIADPMQEAHSSLNTQPTTILLAGGAYIPESSYSSMDLSMPSYTVKSKAALVGGGASVAPEAPKKATTRKPKNVDPEKEAARLAKEEAAAAKKAAAAQAKARKNYEKALAIQAKMEAKAAERAAFQQKSSAQ